MKQVRFSIVSLFVVGLFLLFIFPAAADDPPWSTTGEIKIWAGTDDPPACWMVANGAVLYIAEYPELYDAIGCTYGNCCPDPSSCENPYYTLPNLKGRVPVGYDGSQGEFDNYGETGGEKTHTLTVNEIPSHYHTINGDGTGVTVAGSPYVYRSNGTTSYGFTNYTGGGQAHNNLQPYITLRYIIYVCDQPTPTPTPTDTPTPTSTPVYTGTPTIYLPYTSAYTYTLTSGETLTVPVAASLGQIIISGLILSIIAIVILGFTFKVVYGE